MLNFFKLKIDWIKVHISLRNSKPGYRFNSIMIYLKYKII